MMYEARCVACNHEFTYIASVALCSVVPNCPVCAQSAVKVILSAPLGHVKGKFDPYVSIVDGSLIRNMHDLEEHNRRNGVKLLNDGYDEQTILSGQLGQKKQEESAKDDIAATIEEARHDVYQGYEPKIDTLTDEGAIV